MKQTRARPDTAPRALGGLLRADVLEVADDDTVLVRATNAPTTEVLRAEIAVVGYVPAAGDRVLIERGEEGWFVLGALGEARRRTPLSALVATPTEGGGVELRARQGDLTLSAPGRIALHAAEVETRADRVRTAAGEVVTQAGRLEVEATRIVERAGDTYRHVEGLAELQAGRARTLVEGAHQLAARRTTIQSDEDTIVDGQRVLLG